MAKKTRGSAAPDQQLSQLQRQILLWILSASSPLHGYKKFRESMMIPGESSETIPDLITNLHQKGVPWSAKRFYKDAPSKSQVVALSKAVHRLETRGLVILFDVSNGLGRKPRTTHVRLTSIGLASAVELRHSKGLSRRELLKQSYQHDLKRELWALRRQWIQSEADYRYAMPRFAEVAEFFEALKEWDELAKIPYPKGFDNAFCDYIERLEVDIAYAEDALGVPAKKLSVPPGWKTDGGQYRDQVWKATDAMHRYIANPPF